MAHHEPFKALGRIGWEADVDHFALEWLMERTFAAARTLVASIPVPTHLAACASGGTGRARSATDSAVGGTGPRLTSSQPAGDADVVAKLTREWKEVKVGAHGSRENPLGVAVWRLPGRDGNGTWFARRSIHEGVPFETWRLGFEREFAETLGRSVVEGGDLGNVRGIAAERRVENKVVPGTGKLEVYQLSARFPGPTAPRDFVTLLLTSEPADAEADGAKPPCPRQLMIVSKPCEHPACPPRQGFVRGQYESVEVIREVPLSRPVRRTRSSMDLTGTSQTAEETEMAIEWLMVTRSDPGGSVPRFLVDKGTPGGIISDADRFLTWLSSKRMEHVGQDDHVGLAEDKNEVIAMEKLQLEEPGPLRPVTECLNSQPKKLGREPVEEPMPSGFYGMMAGALGAGGIAGSAMVSQPSSGDTDVDHDDEESGSDTSDVLDYLSAEEGESSFDAGPAHSRNKILMVSETCPTPSSPASGCSSATPSRQHDKDVRKIQDGWRRSKAQTKKPKDEGMTDDVAKRQDRHRRDMARQEDRYRRDLRKLEERRANEERKAAERRRKAADRDDKAAMYQAELAETRAERDVARKQIDLLKLQVGHLQAQNTALVAEMGRLQAGQRTTGDIRQLPLP